MNNIIKRRKTVEYLQLHNFPVQKDLDDLSAIGLLTYIMSLPENWKLHKSWLQSKFSRRKVDGAWKVLSEKSYVIGFSCYVEGKRKYFYNVSDVAFTEQEFLEFVEETLKELIREYWDEKSTIPISSIEIMVDSPFKIPIMEINDTDVQNVQQTNVRNVQQTIAQIVQQTIVRFVQYKMYSTICTVQNVHILNIYIKKIQKQKHINKENNIIVNLQGEPIKFLDKDEFRFSLINACNNFYNEFAPSRWNKESWFKIVNQFVEETVSNERHLTVPEENILGYAYQSLKGISRKHDKKHGKVQVAEGTPGSWIVNKEEFGIDIDDDLPW